MGLNACFKLVELIPLRQLKTNDMVYNYNNMNIRSVSDTEPFTITSGGSYIHVKLKHRLILVVLCKKTNTTDFFQATGYWVCTALPDLQNSLMTMSYRCNIFMTLSQYIYDF